MRRGNPSTDPLHIATWIAGIALAALAVYLHVTFLFHAGGLWRDEVVSFNIATKPTLAELWRSLRYESFPGFSHLVLRAWVGAGLGTTDFAVRVLGCLVGTAIVAALGWNGRLFGRTIPLFSLAFFALSPLAVRTTDAIRAYGIGTFFILLTFGLLFRVVASPSAPAVAAAAIVAILSVHSLYQNAFFVLAICLGAIAVAWRHRHWQRIALVLGIGLATALSLLLYVTPLRQLGEVKPLIAHGVGFSRLLETFSTALADGGQVLLWLWLAAIAAGVAIAVRAQLRDAERDRALFSVIAMLSAIIGFLAWLKIVGFPTQPWYYVPLLALIAVALDTIFGTSPQVGAFRAGQLAIIGVVGALMLVRALPGVRIRQTNVDGIAAQVGSLARSDDFILVDPWFCGASFSRYYKGATPWTTLPPLEDQTLQRLDLFKRYMMARDPIRPVLNRLAATLEAGHRVFVVGSLPFLEKGQVPPDLPPAPGSRWGWDHDAYGEIWGMQTAHFLQRHALRAQPVALAVNEPTQPFEELGLVVIEGWRGDHP